MRISPLLLIFSLFAQDDAGTPAKSGTTGSIGTVTLNGQVYNQLSIRPEIPIGKLGVGLDIYLYFNDEGMYWGCWDFPQVVRPTKPLLIKFIIYAGGSREIICIS